jgi:quercetin dioxygenase-like cupin family protein
MSDNYPKIWGKNEELFHNDLCSVNILTIRKGGTCSWHYHKAKHNQFTVLSGKLKIHTEIGDFIIESGMNVTVQAGIKHLFQALEETKAIEVMYVSYDKNDIERITVGYLDENVIAKHIDSGDPIGDKLIEILGYQYQEQENEIKINEV